MGPTRKRDLTTAVVAAAVFGYLVVRTLYRYFPEITLWTGLSLLALAAGEAVWAMSVRSRIRDGRIGVGAGRLHPLAVARSVAVAKASAWVGAVMLGWWTGVLVYLIPRRSELRVAAVDAPGVATCAISAFALVVAALWLQHCCKSPGEPGASDASEGALGSD
jgi:hypothetical protein